MEKRIFKFQKEDEVYFVLGENAFECFIYLEDECELEQDYLKKFTITEIPFLEWETLEILDTEEYLKTGKTVVFETFADFALRENTVCIVATNLED